MDTDNSELIIKMNKISQEIFENTVVKDPETGLETKPFKKLSSSKQATFFQGKPVQAKHLRGWDLARTEFVDESAFSAFPLFKKVTPRLIDSKTGSLVSIQPMDILPLTKKLKATWSVEAAEDLKANAVHSIGAEEELIQAMSEQILKEIDKNILEGLIEQAQEAEREAAESAERKRKQAAWRSSFSVIGRRYLDPEEERTEEEPEIEIIERKVIVIVPDLPFGLGHRRILA